MLGIKQLGPKEAAERFHLYRTTSALSKAAPVGLLHLSENDLEFTITLKGAHSYLTGRNNQLRNKQNSTKTAGTQLVNH